MGIPGTHASPSDPQRTGARVIPFGGGKGGVGKTFLVANLATALARQGHRVVAVDGDLEGANLHTCLGVTRPRASLADYVAHREDDLEKLLLDTHLPNLSLIAATSSHLAIAQPSHARRVQLLRALRALPAEFVLLDLGAGMHPAVMDYFMVGENGVVVISPEPTSVENAYAFIRAAFYRRLRLAMVSHDVRRLVTLAMDERNERGIRTPIDLLRSGLAKAASPYAGVISAVSRTLPPATVADLQEARRLAMQGPPAESVGLEPFAVTIPVRDSRPVGLR